MKIVVTGGHLMPALALLPTLRRKHEVLFIGRKYSYEGDEVVSLEYESVKTLGVDFRTITAGRLQRRFTSHTVAALFKFPIGFLQSFTILRHYKPGIVLSFGGYVALPVCLAAAALRIPIVTHEQTVSAGLTNRIIAIFARNVCIAFEQSKKYFPPEKTVLTGIPLREGLFDSPPASPFAFPSLPIIYITGGSGGSHSINSHVLGILKELLSRYAIIHQVGAAQAYRDYEKLKEQVDKFPKDLRDRYIVRRFITGAELAWIYRHATLMIGRSGANTVYEILTFGLPSLFIPLPWAAGLEQEANARLAAQIGLAIVLEQNRITKELLLSTIDAMVRENHVYRKQKAVAGRLVIRDANRRILSLVERALISHG